MVDRQDAPTLDKVRLIGGCVRLPVDADAARLAAEIEALGAGVWGTTGGRVGVHRRAEALFLRGYAPAEGDLPIEDRPVLGRLPGVREIIDRLGAPPLRCLLARLPSGAAIAPHIDRGPYFARSIRIHVPVVTSEHVFMYCAGLSYRMRTGEVWALNNSARHGVWNRDPSMVRTHLICDFAPSPALLGLLAAGDRSLGVTNMEVERHLAAVAP